MRQEHIAYWETDLDYRHAAALAATRAEMDKEVIEPVVALDAWTSKLT